VHYHDTEWGVPVHDDRVLFEFLVLESAQAGLSWYTVLKKRAAYREAFAQFDPLVVAAFGAADIDGLMANAGLIRHRGKFEAAIGNARCFLEIQREFGSFDVYLWRYVDGVPRTAIRREHSEIPVTSPESDALAKDLKRRGVKFFGPTIAYAYLQATGLVNDHLERCFRRVEILKG
jgi:DNA-3-methyladenine glycosylase I